MKVLVVDDQPDIQSFLRDVLEEHRYEVLTASNGADALEIYRDHRPSFTLTDISMPGLSGLELLRQIKAINPEAVVMLMTGAGAESFAIEALRGGAVNYFNKPVDINELIDTLNRYSIMAAGYDFEHYAAGFFQEEILRLTLSNNLDQVNHAVQMIVAHSRAVFPIKDIFTLRFGLAEMIINAIEHGNLGITYEEKSRALEENRFSELLQRRAEEMERSGRRVRIECAMSREELRCLVRDDGQGFDHSIYSNIVDPAELFERLGTSLHGRGILLTRLQFDELHFNDKGNEVCMIKRCPPPAVHS